MNARVPNTTRKIIHGFTVEPEFLSVLSDCGGVDADPDYLNVTDDDVTCLGCVLERERSERRVMRWLTTP